MYMHVHHVNASEIALDAGYLCLNLFSVINFANSIIMCLGQPMGGMLIFTFIFAIIMIKEVGEEEA